MFDITSSEELPLLKSHYFRINSDLVKIARAEPLEAVSSQWAYIKNFEEAWGITLSPRAELIRTTLHELERLIWCLDYFEALLKVLGHKDTAKLWAYEKEGLFEFREYAFGSRLFPQTIALGGVSKDLVPGAKKRLYNHLHSLIPQIEDTYETSLTHFILLKGKMPFDRDDIERMSWGGPIAQSAGSQWDARFFAPYGAYNLLTQIRPTLELRLKAPVCDAFDRVDSVYKATLSTLRQLKKILEELPLSGDLITKWDMKNERPIFHSSQVVEGPSGPIYVSLFQGRYDVSTSRTRSQLLWDQATQHLDLQARTQLEASMGRQYTQGVSL